MDILSVLLQTSSRRIGIFIPDVVISEKHSDRLEITEHPVERPTTAENAASVSDHAFRQPSEVVMETGFAGGGSLLDFTDTSSKGLSLGMSPAEVYQQLLELQRRRVPFDVTTGKRTYSNMLIKALDVTTDRTSENVLMVIITLREVIFTSSSEVKVAAKENMTGGVETSAVQNTGAKTTTDASSKSSLLATIIRGASGQ
ncbi:phage baseplate protein [Escherichia coli]|uniref:phage baseplate protein n=1 Tax=Escherichia sp. 20412-1 TaxID=2137853 RepID=UPI000D160F32|nr:hypothetical protein [Escherichia sp. 20412-1]PSY61260.1 hypothetical protein C7B16_21380 [Escherichia sp. 20412-1]